MHLGLWFWCLKFFTAMLCMSFADLLSRGSYSISSMCWLESADALAVVDSHGQLAILAGGGSKEKLQIMDKVIGIQHTWCWMGTAKSA